MPEIFEVGIIGMGPAGIGMAISLRDESALKSTICFERGANTSGLDCPALTQNECGCLDICSIISGIGGASTLSSGKISDFPAGSGLVDFFDSEQQLRESLSKIIAYLTDKIALKKVEVNDEVKKCAKAFYKQRNIDYKYYDVYEFDGNRYRNFIQETVQALRDDGLQLLDNTEVINISRDPDALHFRITAKTVDGEELFLVRNLVLATGALDIRDRLIDTLFKSVANSFELGVRVEVCSSALGNALLAHGDLKLKFGSGKTYCVTTNGRIIAYQTGDVHFLEGCMDCSASTDYTNLAVLIKCDDKTFGDFIAQYREKYSGFPVKQKFTDYLNQQISQGDVKTTLVSATCGDINTLLPININNAIKEFISSVFVEGMNIPEDAITLVAPEVKILRNLQIAKDFGLGDDLFVIGAATGKFRGILQSFCSGIRCGQLLIRG